MNTSPTSHAAADRDSPQARRNRVLLVGLAALFFVPLTISFLLYFVSDWRPSGTTNNGELVQPMVVLSGAQPLRTPDGAVARAALFEGKWTFLYAGDGACTSGSACERALWTIRQTRLLLAEDMGRVQRVFVATRGCCNEAFLQREHVGLETLVPEPGAAGEAFLARLPATDREFSVFVVDPLGNLMLRFDTRENPKGLLKDIQRLLKLSHIG